MLFVPLHLLKSGMILAESIPSYNLHVPLVTAGQPLSERLIRSLRDHGIQGAYIESAVAEGIEPQEFFTPQKRTSLLEGIKTEYERVRTSGDKPNGKIFEEMAVEVVLSALEQEHLLYNVITIRNYDDYTYSHSLYVGGIATLIGANMKLKKQQLVSLATAGLLHDIGKLQVPLSIINKPAALTDSEYSAMQEHPLLGVTRLSKNKLYPSIIIKGVESHHEFYNGDGYPFGLTGENIPLFGRILSLADVYDALSSARSYRPAWNPNKIIDYITSRSGIQFDPNILPFFLQSVAAFPVGMLVRLSNGWTGIVTKNYPEFILRPCIRIIHPDAECGRELDLAHSLFNITVEGPVEDALDLNLTKPQMVHI